MPADVIWADSGTEQRQLLSREGEQGGRKEPSSAASPSPPARGSGFSSSSRLLLHTSPRCLAAPTLHRLGGVFCLSLKSSAKAQRCFPTHGVRHNSSLSPQQQPIPCCFSIRYTQPCPKHPHHPMPSPSALSLLLDHQGFVLWGTAESQNIPPSPAVAVLSC